MANRTYRDGSSHPVSMKQAFGLFWKNYVKFQGTSSRSEFWWWFLWNIIIHLPVLFLVIIGIVIAITRPLGFVFTVFGALIGAVLNLGMLLPSLALSVRRLRDAGMDTSVIITLLIGENVTALIGAFYLPLLAISGIIGIIMFVFYLKPSKEKYNQKVMDSY